ncbi:MAG: palindromic element RPE1 domain-containing protein [Holosporales bacterium]|jgi:RPE1 domain-containing protein|nr:palindromic element RPE1 domain-containing protein [Holosporales bacterium]
MLNKKLREYYTKLPEELSEEAAEHGREIEYSWAVSDIIAAFHLTSCPSYLPISGFSINSKTIRKGECFIAIKGERFDGHDFLEEAFSNGAALCIVERPPECAVEGKSYVIVENTKLALIDLAIYARERTKAIVLGISGSVGKTTVRSWIAELLCAADGAGRHDASCGADSVVSTTHNYNGFIGLPLSMLPLSRGTDFGVFEIGIDSVGAMQKLAGLCKPNIAVLTKVAPAHVAGFPSLEALAEQKAQLFSGLREGGVAIIHEETCEDFPQVLRVAREYCSEGRVIPIGQSERATVRLEKVQEVRDGWQKRPALITAQVAGVRVQYRFNSTNRADIINSLIALTAALCALYARSQDIGSFVDLGCVMRNLWPEIAEPLTERLETLQLPIGRGDVSILQLCCKNAKAEADDVSIGPLSKPSKSEFCEGDTEHRSGACLDVREHSSTGSTYQKTDFEEFGKRSIGTATLIDSSYNANPASMMSALGDFCDSYASAPRRIVILGGMLELGDISDDEHAKIFRFIANSNIDRVYALGPAIKPFFDAFSDASPQKAAVYAESPEKMFQLLSNELITGDVILAKGSFSTNVHKVVSMLKQLFSH